MVLTIRTDKPEAEIGLFYDTGQKRHYKKWLAHRQLAESIHKEILNLLQAENISWQDIDGIVCFKGPGSFTGIRIGITIGNSLAYSLRVKIVGETGEDWIEQGLNNLANKKGLNSILPEYGRLPHITQPKK